MSTDNGGPAFPITEWHLNGKTHADWRGMGLRDYFAAKAMQALCGNEKAMDAVVKAGHDPTQVVADAAYSFADAMLKARQRTPE